jgi:hypothetical protein
MADDAQAGSPSDPWMPASKSRRQRIHLRSRQGQLRSASSIPMDLLFTSVTAPQRPAPACRAHVLGHKAMHRTILCDQVMRRNWWSDYTAYCRRRRWSSLYSADHHHQLPAAPPRPGD